MREEHVSGFGEPRCEACGRVPGPREQLYPVHIKTPGTKIEKVQFFCRGCCPPGDPDEEAA